MVARRQATASSVNTPVLHRVLRTYVRPIIALSPIAQRAGRDRTQDRLLEFLSTQQTGSVFMEPHTATRAAGISRRNCFYVRVHNALFFHGEEKRSGSRTFRVQRDISEAGLIRSD